MEILEAKLSVMRCGICEDFVDTAFEEFNFELGICRDCEENLMEKAREQTE